jgi:hypothetical protein
MGAIAVRCRDRSEQSARDMSALPPIATELLAARIFPANLQFAGRFSEIAGRADPIWLSNCLISQDFGRNSRDLRSRERFWGIAGKVLGIAGKILGNCREKSGMQLRMVAGFGAHGEQG